MTRASFWFLAVPILICGCDAAEPYEPARFVLSSGQETGLWTRDPMPVRAEVIRTFEGGQPEPYLNLDMPPTSFSMDYEGTPEFELRGYDSSDALRVWGRSLAVDAASLAGTEIRLFVQRTGELARPLGALTYDHGQSPPVAILGGQWILVAGKAEAGRVLTETYDFGYWGYLAAPELRCLDEDAICQPRTLAVVGSVVIVAIGDNWLRSYAYGLTDDDLLSVSFVDGALPTGLSEFSEVAGGQVVTAPDGDVYVVGGTRLDDPPSPMVLRITAGTSGTAGATLQALSLATARAGAAATWVEGQGLVVTGGSADGAGVEVLAEGATEFVAIPYPADPTLGAAIAAVDATTVLRVGGRDATDQPAATVSLALDCTATCVAEAGGDPVDLRAATGFSLGSGSVLAVGTGPDDMTAVFRVVGGVAEAIPLKQPRGGASSILAPTGHVALVGGVLASGEPARSIELFAPF